MPDYQLTDAKLLDGSLHPMNPMSPSWDGKLEQYPTVEPNIKDNKLSLRRTEAFPSRPQPNR